MNRWLKYGGIMPETVNISSVTWESGYINNNGTLVEGTNTHRSSYFLLKPGTYKIKWYSRDDYNSTNTTRIHRYNMNQIWIEMISSLVLSNLKSDKIYTQTITINETSLIRLSSNRYLFPMEIEKL